MKLANIKLSVLFKSLLIAVFLICSVSSFSQDATGANTGTAADISAATAGKPSAEEVAAQTGHNKIAINMMWTLLAGFLVMFMQAGFALVETGFTQKKKCCPHNGYELYGVCRGHVWILDLWFCIYVWRGS